LVYVSVLVCLDQEKSGNPADEVSLDGLGNCVLGSPEYVTREEQLSRKYLL
jgi:hypothetical protein